MNFEEFTTSLSGHVPPKEVGIMLQALWYDANDDWEKAHDLAQSQNDSEGAWIHAYLHRKEGDRWNANYWYNRAGKIMPENSIGQEWEDIVKTLLKA
jgi:hypothetical protein